MQNCVIFTYTVVSCRTILQIIAVKAVMKLSKTDELEAGRVLFKNCWLGGNEWLEKDAVLFIKVQE